MHWVGVFVALVQGWGCHNSSFDSDEEADQIFTIRESERDFSAYRSYAMPDEVFDLSALVEDPVDRDKTLDPSILEAFARNMSVYGYTRLPIEEVEQADVVLLVGSVISDHWSWYGYYPCWDPYYCWWYPPVAVPVNFQVGSLVGTLVRLQESTASANGPEALKVIWGAGMRGVVDAGSRQQDLIERIDNVVDQAFTQSPYLTDAVAVGGAP